jgi:uncharacterized protein YbjQ (UPF0145 family)
MPANFLVTTNGSLEGLSVREYLGVVRGIAVRVPTFRQGMQALSSALSGNLQAGAEMYAQVCEAARAEAYQRMIEHAQEMGADAVIAMRYDATDVGESATEVLAYGTAVKLKFPEVVPVAKATETARAASHGEPAAG